jgi:hypothetical protein
MGALDRLGELLATVESRESLQVDPSAPPAPPPHMQTDDEAFVGEAFVGDDGDRQNRESGPNGLGQQGDQNGQHAGDFVAGSASSSASHSSGSVTVISLVFGLD